MQAEYGSMCMSFAYNILRNQEDAEECWNDTLLAIWNAIPPACPENLKAFIFRILRNIALDQYRKKHSVKRGNGEYECAIDELAEILAGSNNTESEVENREMLSAVNAFLNTLSDTKKELFMKRYWRLCSIADIAEEYHLSENNVKVTLHRVRQNLQKHLKKEGLL
ncbi:MAG: sigma-70 family RNA polymerase sigma factor [Oscillospiraceae bacterium]|nr:sigma-70 family RNA polymerase sigma factor [Oscillospiraceae bacterium]